MKIVRVASISAFAGFLFITILFGGADMMTHILLGSIVFGITEVLHRLDILIHHLDK